MSNSGKVGDMIMSADQRPLIQNKPLHSDRLSFMFAALTMDIFLPMHSLYQRTGGPPNRNFRVEVRKETI